MKLRNRKSLVHKRDEGNPPAAPRVKLTKWIYFSILIFIAGYLALTGVRYFDFPTTLWTTELSRPCTRPPTTPWH